MVTPVKAVRVGVGDYKAAVVMTIRITHWLKEIDEYCLLWNDDIKKTK